VNDIQNPLIDARTKDPGRRHDLLDARGPVGEDPITGLLRCLGLWPIRRQEKIYLLQFSFKWKSLFQIFLYCQKKQF
jgi:hypothetical protein